MRIVLCAGDEILAVNEESLVGLSHAEAIAVFKRIKSGDVALTVVRRSACGAGSSGSGGCSNYVTSCPAAQ